MRDLSSKELSTVGFPQSVIWYQTLGRIMKMGKVKSIGSLPPDHPIFSGGVEIFSRPASKQSPKSKAQSTTSDTHTQNIVPDGKPTSKSKASQNTSELNSTDAQTPIVESHSEWILYQSDELDLNGNAWVETLTRLGPDMWRLTFEVDLTWCLSPSVPEETENFMDRSTDGLIEYFLFSEEGETEQPPGPRLKSFLEIARLEGWSDVAAKIDEMLK